MKKVSLRAWVTIVIIAIISIIAFRINGNNFIFTGFLFALLGIFLIGILSNKYVAPPAGGLIVGMGILARKYFPIASRLKDAKLEEFITRNTNYQAFLENNIILLIAAGVIVGLLAGLLGEYLQNRKSFKFSAIKITYMAIFIALSAMINSLRIGNVSFGGFPIIMSGYLLGPLPGFIVGAIADLVGFMIRPSSFAFNPLFTLTSALTGALPILVTRLLGEKYPNFSFIKVLIGIFVGQIITSVIMVPIFSVLLYGANTFWVLASSAFLKQIVSIPIYAILVKTLNDSLKRVINFDKEFV